MLTEESSGEVVDHPVPKRRGRPPKNGTLVKRGPGRPKKNGAEVPAVAVEPSKDATSAVDAYWEYRQAVTKLKATEHLLQSYSHKLTEAQKAYEEALIALNNNIVGA